MAPVMGGETLIPEKNSKRRDSVPSFFIDRCEVTVREYQEFMAQHAALACFKDAARLWPDEKAFERFGRPETIVPPYFAEVKDIRPDWPVEDVNYHQALACLRFRGKDLPTLAEWFLAARGAVVGDRHPFEEPSLEIHRNPERPSPVSQSGEARGFPPRFSVHHLAGNVAEWCKVQDQEAKRAQLLGGRYLDTDPRYFIGERRDSLPLGASGRGYGFRGVVRPREVFADLIPKGLD